MGKRGRLLIEQERVCAMDLGIKGRVALVTGASQGLGRASAEALATEGVRLVIAARREPELSEARDELVALGAEVLAIPSDMSIQHVPEMLVTRALEHFGRLDIVVGNAGGPPLGRALDVSDDQIEQAIQTNLMASVRLVRAAAPIMSQAHWGRICLITSNAVKQPKPRLSLSNTARTGLVAWAKTAAADLFERGITLNVICPGPHTTERLKTTGWQGVAGDPGDFGKIVAFLCSEQTKFVTGTTLTVDGGENVGLF
jgi:3-oxoacyl-[acyl-carrier protein] reductase